MEAVYAHVPNKFHELVDSAIFSDFGTNVIFVASGKDAIFEETGKTTGIPFQKYFRQYKKLLTVKGVTSVAIKDTEDVGDEDEEAAFKAAMEALDLGGSDDEENIESDAMNTETHPGETESDAAIDDDDDGEQVEVNNAVNHKDGPAEVNNEVAANGVDQAGGEADSISAPLESPAHAVNAQLIFSIAPYPYHQHRSSQRPR
ncbi:hypothetical protein B0H10DRAFT_2206245 [Mycena sp. CBHHK59/15]|nr:hypothetical protein B0H10DRAFT_2206245 [Mycena sp. CBHHK59/15]